MSGDNDSPTKESFCHGFSVFEDFNLRASLELARYADPVPDINVQADIPIDVQSTFLPSRPINPFASPSFCINSSQADSHVEGQLIRSNALGALIESDSSSSSTLQGSGRNPIYEGANISDGQFLFTGEPLGGNNSGMEVTFSEERMKEFETFTAASQGCNQTMRPSNNELFNQSFEMEVERTEPHLNVNKRSSSSFTHESIRNCKELQRVPTQSSVHNLPDFQEFLRESGLKFPVAFERSIYSPENEFDRFMEFLRNKKHKYPYTGRIARVLDRVVHEFFCDDEALHLPEEINSFLINSMSQTCRTKIADSYRSSGYYGVFNSYQPENILPFVLMLNSFQEELSFRKKPKLSHQR